MAGMLLGIESILGEGTLLMSQVKPALDLERWKDLAEIEMHVSAFWYNFARI